MKRGLPKYEGARMISAVSSNSSSVCPSVPLSPSENGKTIYIRMRIHSQLASVALTNNKRTSPFSGGIENDEKRFIVLIVASIFL